MSSYNQNVSTRELEITSLRVFKYTPVFFFLNLIKHYLMRYDCIIPVELKNYQPYTVIYIYICMYLISGYLAWYLSVVYANFYWLNTWHAMTKSAQGKKEKHENSGYWFTSEAKGVKLQSQKCIAEVHVWRKDLTQATASADTSCSEFLVTTSWPPQGRAALRTLWVSSAFKASYGEWCWTSDCSIWGIGHL